MQVIMPNKEKGIITQYWNHYGGWKKVFFTSSLWFSIAITIILYPLWLNHPWWEDVLSLIPSLLGFTLTGFALWLAVGNDKFKSDIAGEEEDGSASPYMSVNATFTHFLFLQMISIFLALIGKAYIKPENENLYFTPFRLDIYFQIIFGYFGFLIFIYALFSALGAIFALYRTSKWYDEWVSHVRKRK